jgi:hypothetical protein
MDTPKSDLRVIPEFCKLEGQVRWLLFPQLFLPSTNANQTNRTFVVENQLSHFTKFTRKHRKPVFLDLSSFLSIWLIMSALVALLRFLITGHVAVMEPPDTSGGETPDENTSDEEILEGDTLERESPENFLVFLRYLFQDTSNEMPVSQGDKDIISSLEWEGDPYGNVQLILGRRWRARYIRIDMKHLARLRMRHIRAESRFLPFFSPICKIFSKPNTRNGLVAK